MEKFVKNLILLFFVFPIFFVSWTMYPWNFGKTVYFLIFVDLVFALALFFILFFRGKLKKFLLLDYAVFGFLLVMLFSSFFGVDFEKSFFGDQQRAQGTFVFLHFGLFYLLLRQFFNSKKDWLLASLISVFSAFVSLVVGFLGYFKIAFESLSFGGRISGLEGNPIFFAGYLLLPAFLSFLAVLFFDEKLKHQFKLLFGLRNWLYFLGFLLFFGIFFSQARGVALGIILSLLFFWLIFSFSEIFKKSIKRIVFLVGVVFFAFLAFLYVFNQKSSFFADNYPEVSRFLDITTENKTAKTRLIAWDIAKEGFLKRPIFGFGPENYQAVFNKYYNPDLLKYSFSETVWDKPHNYFLEILAEEGIFGIIFYIFIIFVAFYYVYYFYKQAENKREKVFAIVFFGALLAFLTKNAFAFETFSSLLMWFFMLAFCAFLYEFAKNKEEFYELKNKAILNFSFFVALVFVGFSLFFSANMLKSSYYMSSARDALGINSVYKWQESAKKAISAFPFEVENAVFLTKDLSDFDNKNLLTADVLKNIYPDIESVLLKRYNKSQDFLSAFWLGQLYALLGEYVDSKYYQDSIKYFNAAWKVNKDRQAVPLLLGKVYSSLGENKKAIEILEELARKNDSLPEPHWFLGLAYLEDGQEEKGILELEKGKEFGLNLKNNILFLLDLYLKREEYEKTIPLYERLIKIDPKNPTYYHDLGLMYFAVGDKDKSFEYFQTAIQMDPSLKDRVKKFFKLNGITINFD